MGKRMPWTAALHGHCCVVMRSLLMCQHICAATGMLSTAAAFRCPLLGLLCAVMQSGLYYWHQSPLFLADVCTATYCGVGRYCSTSGICIDCKTIADGKCTACTSATQCTTCEPGRGGATCQLQSKPADTHRGLCIARCCNEPDGMSCVSDACSRHLHKRRRAVCLQAL